MSFGVLLMMFIVLKKPSKVFFVKFCYFAKIRLKWEILKFIEWRKALLSASKQNSQSLYIVQKMSIHSIPQSKVSRESTNNFVLFFNILNNKLPRISLERKIFGIFSNIFLSFREVFIIDFNFHGKEKYFRGIFYSE